MHEWFYVMEGEQRGPVDEARLRDWLRNGMLPGSTLVWREGMTDWVQAADVPVLCHARALATSEDPDVAEPAPPSPWAEGSQKRPWIRLFARSIDVMLFSMLVGLVLGSISPELMVQGNIVVPMLVLLGFAFVEPLLLIRWGTTPGKALLRVRVRRADGGLLTYRQALERSLHVWLRGLGMGLPFVGMLAQFLAYLDLMSRGSSAWDRLCGSRVEHARIDRRRLILTGTILVCGLGLAVAGAWGR